MDGAYNVGILVINRIPLEVLFVEFKNSSNIHVGLIDSLVFHLRLPFSADELSRKITVVEAVLGIVDCAIREILWGFVQIMVRSKGMLLAPFGKCLA